MVFDLGKVAVEGLVEATIGGLLKQWTAEDLHMAIQKDIILMDMVLQFYPSLVSTGRAITRHFPDGPSKLTDAIVMKWVEKNHGEFLSPLRTERGRVWLRKNLEVIRQVFWKL